MSNYLADMWKEESTRYSQELSEMYERHAKLRDEYDMALKEISGANGEIDQLNKKNASLEEANSRVSSEAGKHMEHKEALQKQSNSQISHIQAVEEELVMVRRQLGEANRTSSEKSEMIKSLELKLNSALEKTVALQGDLKTCHAIVAKQDRQLEETKMRSRASDISHEGQLKAKAEDLDRAKRQVEVTGLKAQQYAKEVVTARGLLNSEKKTTLGLREGLVAVEAELNRFKNLTKELDIAVQTKNRDVLILTQELARQRQVTVPVADFEAVKTKFGITQSENTALHSQLTDNAKKYRAIKTEYENAQNLITQQARRENELCSSHGAMEKYLKDQATDVKQKLDSMTTYNDRLRAENARLSVDKQIYEARLSTTNLAHNAGPNRPRYQHILQEADKIKEDANDILSRARHVSSLTNNR